MGFSTMYHHMCLKIGCGSKFLITKRTSKWLFSSMDHNVVPEIRGMFKALVTLMTRKWLFSSVDPHACLEVTGPRKSLVGADSYVYFQGEGPAAGGFYPGCTASGSTVIAVGTSTPFVATLAQVTSVVRTVVLVSLAHAAVGSSRGLAAALFAQPCTGGALTGFSG